MNGYTDYMICDTDRGTWNCAFSQVSALSQIFDWFVGYFGWFCMEL